MPSGVSDSEAAARCANSLIGEHNDRGFSRASLLELQRLPVAHGERVAIDERDEGRAIDAVLHRARRAVESETNDARVTVWHGDGG